MSQLDHATLPTFKAPADGKLDEAMMAGYRETGVLILEDFVPVDECKRLQERALELVYSFDPSKASSTFASAGNPQHDDRYFIESGDKIRFFFEAEAYTEDGSLKAPLENSLNKMGHAMHDLDPEFERFSHRPELAEIASRLGLQDPGIIQSMYIFKPPHFGGEVVSHQDSTFIYTDPESCVGFWFAIDDATVENGCMRFIPGEHLGPLKQRNRRAGKYQLETVVFDDSPWPMERELVAEAAAGTLVIFDGRTPHRSETNRSSKARHAYTLHAIDRRSRYPSDNWLQRGDHLPLQRLCLTCWSRTSFAKNATAGSSGEAEIGAGRERDWPMTALPPSRFRHWRWPFTSTA